MMYQAILFCCVDKRPGEEGLITPNNPSEVNEKREERPNLDENQKGKHAGDRRQIEYFLDDEHVAVDETGRIPSGLAMMRAGRGVEQVHGLIILWLMGIVNGE